MSKTYVINDKVVKSWFRRGNARIPIFEDGTIARNQNISKLNNKNRYTKQELKDKYGTDNIDIINAGKEAENRVELKTENQIKTENKALDNLKNKTLSQRAREIDKEYQMYKQAQIYPEDIEKTGKTQKEWLELDKKYYSRYEKERHNEWLKKQKTNKGFNDYQAKYVERTTSKLKQLYSSSFGEDKSKIGAELNARGYYRQGNRWVYKGTK